MLYYSGHAGNQSRSSSYIEIEREGVEIEHPSLSDARIINAPRWNVGCCRITLYIYTLLYIYRRRRRCPRNTDVHYRYSCPRARALVLSFVLSSLSLCLYIYVLCMMAREEEDVTQEQLFSDFDSVERQQRRRPIVWHRFFDGHPLILCCMCFCFPVAVWFLS